MVHCRKQPLKLSLSHVFLVNLRHYICLVDAIKHDLVNAVISGKLK